RQRKAAKPTDLDALARGQGLGHCIEHGLDRVNGVAGGQLGIAGRQCGDQLRLGHYQTSLRYWSSLALSSAPRLVVPEEALASDMRWIVSAVSALSRALIDSWFERVLRSMLTIMASMLSPAFSTVVASSTRPDEISEARR